MANRRPRYTDEFRASAVLMLEAAGYPSIPGALRKVSEHLKVPERTLSRWYRAEQNPPPDKLVREKRGDLVGDLLDLLGLSMRQARNTVGEATYREVMTGVGILVDKLQLLSGEPTERQEINVSDHRDRLLATVARKADGLIAGESSGAYSQPIA